MKRVNNIAVLTLLVLAGCTGQVDPLPSWNEGKVKNQIIEYVENQAAAIPIEDRVAVFDMDGTIACEQPIWFEMTVAAEKAAELCRKNPQLAQEQPEYDFGRRLAENPADTSVLNNWASGPINYIDSLIVKPFVGCSYEEYVDFAKKTLESKEAPKYGMKWADMFYQPMIEVIDYLKANQFQIYIVSGSMQAIVWSVCPQAIGFDRSHLIGTRQVTSVRISEEKGFESVIEQGKLKPINNDYGKILNIYNRIGKVPVIAFGNSVGDFGMFRMVSASKYPHLVVMINHDDAEREYAYKPYYTKTGPAWEDSLAIHNWTRADMSKEFKKVWMEK